MCPVRRRYAGGFLPRDSLGRVPSVEVTLIGKPDCHLCDDARGVISGVIQALAGADVTLVERSILEDQALHDEYWEQIPVVLIDGVRHTFWRVDPGRLLEALKERI